MSKELASFNTLGLKHLWVRIDIGKPSEVDQFLDLDREDKTALLYKDGLIHPSRFDEPFFDAVIKQHLDCAKRLADHGVERMAIAATDDGILQKILSPRFSSLDLATRARPLYDIYSQTSKLFNETLVWLTVEELAPGGLDATDGIEIAKRLSELGLKHMVASSGTKDFSPLYYRRATKEKLRSDDFGSNEPALASALWIIQNTDLLVSSFSFIDDDEVALRLAQQLGIHSIIKKTA